MGEDQKDIKLDKRTLEERLLADPENAIVSIYHLVPPSDDPRCVPRRQSVPLGPEGVFDYILGPKSYLPFLVHDEGRPMPHVYTYVNHENQRLIIASAKEHDFDSGFWERYPDGQLLAMKLHMFPSEKVTYDEVKEKLVEDESGLRMRLRKMQAKTGAWKRVIEQKEDAVKQLELEKKKALEESGEFRIRAQRATERLKYDALTGALSRFEFEENTAEHVKRAARNEVPAYVLCFDIKKFKEYNDTYMHATGDEVLKATAKALQSALKKSTDYLYRPGGDEFVAVLERVEHGLETVIKNINAEIDQIRIHNPYFDEKAVDLKGRKVYEEDDRFLRVKVNIGYARLDHPDPKMLRGKDGQFCKEYFKTVCDEADKMTYDDKKGSAGRSTDTHRHTKKYRELTGK